MQTEFSFKKCIIDQIINREVKAHIVYEEDEFIAFLDHRPLFPGHVLLAPKQHVKTLYDLADNRVQRLFVLAKKIGKSVELAMQATGSFIALNNTVSQSIPHLHVHIVPRNKGDGLKGFFWPRTGYQSEEQILEIIEKIRREVKRLVI